MFELLESISLASHVGETKNRGWPQALSLLADGAESVTFLRLGSAMGACHCASIVEGGAGSGGTPLAEAFDP